MFFQNRQIRMPLWLPITAIIFFINAALVSAAYFGFERHYAGKAYPGIYAGQADLSGKTAVEIKSIIEEKINLIASEGVTFAYGYGRSTIFPITPSLNPDLARELIVFDPETTVKNILDYGRKENFFNNLKSKARALIFHDRLPIIVSSDEERIITTLAADFKELEKPTRDASLVYATSSSDGLPAGRFVISEESSGETIDYRKGAALMAANLAWADNSPIWLSSEKTYPEIMAEDCFGLENKAASVLEMAPLALSGNGHEWKIGKDLLASWLHLEINPGLNGASGPGDKIIIALDPTAVKDFLDKSVAPAINKEPADAKFQIINGQLARFQTSSDGIKLDIDASFEAISSGFFRDGKREIALDIKKVESAVGLEEVNNLGLKEIIGTGGSNFAGSPKNRRHNIKVGADSVNGALIKPGDEFSLLKTLGKIDGSTGYLPELVIKENKTTPEFGGGLCQIGTTVFRAALASGLPITQRRNHSYRVSYYEPAGTDATIYDPAPDFRFVNDTGNYLLIQSRIEGDNLYFDFWGTEDGRIVEKTKPTIYNIVKPRPARIVETPNLKPGEKKCTEKAHNGADAYFDYKVTYANGDIEEKRFSSHYVPWQEVCLLGVKETSASSTPASISGTNAGTTATTTP